MLHRRFFPAGDFLPGRRSAPEALPDFGPFADRPDVASFFDLADLEDFGDFAGLAGDLTDLRPRAPLSFSPEEVVWRRGDFLLRLPEVGSPSERCFPLLPLLPLLPRLEGATPASSRSIFRSSRSTRATLTVTAPPSWKICRVRSPISRYLA